MIVNGNDNMEETFAQRYVPVWGFKMYPPDNGSSLIDWHRELRNWLTQNIGAGAWEKIGSGIWETEIKGPDDPYSLEYAYVLVTIDKDAEEEAMAFKLAWE